MVLLILEEAQEFEVLPADSVIQVKVLAIEKKTVDSGQQPWDKLEFKFEVVRVFVPGYESVVGAPIWGSVAARFTTHSDNKLRHWAEALLGMTLEVGFELNTDYLVGRQAKAVTRQYKTRTGQDRHQVDSLLPMGDPILGARPQAPPQVPVGVGASAPILDNSIPF